MPRRPPTSKTAHKVVARIFAGLSAGAGLLAGSIGWLFGEPPKGAAGRIFGFLWQDLPAWSHGVTFAIASIFVYAAVWLYERFEGEAIDAEAAARALDVQDKELRAQEARGRRLEAVTRELEADKQALEADLRNQLGVAASLYVELSNAGEALNDHARRAHVLAKIDRANSAYYTAMCERILRMLQDESDLLILRCNQFGLSRDEVIRQFGAAFFGEWDPPEGGVPWLFFQAAHLTKMLDYWISNFQRYSIASRVLSEEFLKDPGAAADDLVERSLANPEVIAARKRKPVYARDGRPDEPPPPAAPEA
jgi:hypothetical protein